MKIQSVYGFLIRGFRSRRMKRFARTFGLAAETTVLDVGGTPLNWELLGEPARVTLLNRSFATPSSRSYADFALVEGCGKRLAFANASFDVAFSNSVIEHVGGYDEQRVFASELRRVGRQVWVQTPARGFFLEPHLITPFIHYRPIRWQRRLLRNFSVWGWLTRPSRQVVERFLASTRLLSHAELRELFPDCEIRRERFLGLTKAYVAVRQAPA